MDEPVREGDARATIAGTPGAIAGEHWCTANVAALRVDDDRRQLERVAQAEIEPLASNRMQRVRRVADHGDAIGSRRTRYLESQRKRAPRADAAKSADTATEVRCELVEKRRIGERQRSPRRVRRLRPDEPVVLAFRQERNRPVGRESLVRDAT